MRHRRSGAAACAAILLTLAACGSGSDGAIAPSDASATIAGPANDAVSGDAVTDGAMDEGGDPTVASVADASVEPTSDGVADLDPAAPAATDDPAAETPVAESPVTESPVTESPVAELGPTEATAPAEPVVGGRLFAADVQPEAELDSNPFPDLVVDDIGKDAEVNIRNILPSDRPVLLWAWAPH